ncbi:chitinase 1 [[Candida] railenensis]|uniref:chitinase n=1 Tax=[Candida] railenensis TaxID=45579 RepID=A0A9P0QNT1_9ASCO|nr:chitinase 1 [[Candida] railenensis]
MFSHITKMLITTFLLTNVAEASGVVAYWGQNSAGDQGPLRNYCGSTADIIVVSFINSISPVDISLNDQCSGSFNDGTMHCPSVGEDITYCQKQGKKILLSIGGQGEQGFSSDSEATTFASNVWNKFAGGSSDERPFDTAVVDGFDLDLETVGPKGTVAFGKAIKSLFSKDSARTYYLSAAPQCPYPDATLSDYLTQVPVDFTFVQFYNNPSCQLDGDFNFNTWSQYARSSSPNKKNKIFVGLPGSSSSSGSGFVSASVVKSQLEKIKCDPNFGGVSLWDASSSFPNGFAASIKSVLSSMDVSSCPSTTSYSSGATSTSAASTLVPPLLFQLVARYLVAVSSMFQFKLTSPFSP